jgi:predicted Zn-dependent protease
MVFSRFAKGWWLIALGFAVAIPPIWAYLKLRAAQSDMARFRPKEAREAFASSAWMWGSWPSIRLQACRAAWQDGDPEAAIFELRLAQRAVGGATDETAFEWALIRSAAGDMGEFEEYLQKRADISRTDAPLVWEALALGYLRVYRTLDAMTCLNYWLKRDPDNVRALDLRGQTYVAGKGVVRGSEDYRRVLELDPTREATRWRLVDCLIGLGGYDEAAASLEYLANGRADSGAVASRLARCYNMLGRTAEARALLDAALAKNPNDGSGLRALGQVELVARRPDAAEPLLRRAAALLPNDYQAQQLLFQALQQQGKTDEAKAQIKITEEVRERAERVGELTSRKLAESPLDPALNYEMGKLLLESGSVEVGEQWLLTAIRLDPRHKLAHAALASLYERRGDVSRAGFHRSLADPRD